MIWWIIGMPVLWLRRIMCRAGLHLDETDAFGGYADHCLRCRTKV